MALSLAAGGPFPNLDEALAEIDARAAHGGGRWLLYGLNFAPELTGIGKYTGELAEHLARRGHSVTVVTGYPYYPHWRLDPHRPNWRWSVETWRGVRVIRCPLWVCRRPTAMKRILHLLSFALSSAPAVLYAALRHRPETLFVVEPTCLAAPVGLVAARLVRAEAWLHVQDLELGAALGVGLVGQGLTARVAQGLYGRLLARFDRVTTLSRRMRAALAALGRDTGRIGLFPNWVDAEHYRLVDARALRAELGLTPGQFVALYAGSMGEKQGVECLLDAARLLETDPAIRLVLCGAGPARARIEARLAAHPNVLLLDPQPEPRFLQLLSLADCHLLPQKRGITHFVMPSKLGPMLASGKPIVAQAEPGCEVALALAGPHRVVPPEEVAPLAAAVGSLARRSPGRRRLAQTSGAVPPAAAAG